MSLRDKLEAWVQSPEGQRRIREKVQEYSRTGVSKTKGGSEIVTKETATMLAQQLANMITAHAGVVPASVGADMGQMAMSGPYLVDGGTAFQVELGFTGNLGRPSLVPSLGGVDNIIALFNSGYVANRAVRGMWHGLPVTSRTSRPPLHFMQDAVDEFNATYGKRYNVTVELSGIYDADNGFNDSAYERIQSRKSK